MTLFADQKRNTHYHNLSLPQNSSQTLKRKHYLIFMLVVDLTGKYQELYSRVLLILAAASHPSTQLPALVVLPTSQFFEVHRRMQGNWFEQHLHGPNINLVFALHPILKDLWTPIQYVEGRYYHFLMAYLDDINDSINYMPSYTQPKLHYHDQAIMEISLKFDVFTIIQHRRINCVRMYLDFTCLSELWNSNSQSIHTTFLVRTYDTGPYHTSLSCANQPKPNTQSWILWEWVICLVTQSDCKTLKTHLWP